MSSHPLNNTLYRIFGKRILDIVSALILIVLFSPISIITAILLKLDTKGPVFADTPDRVGQNGEHFRMFKFRSMIVNAHFMLREDKMLRELYEEYKRDSYKLREDPRITKVGKFIRKHSIDEVPQLFNVLKGEMSLVGPRAYYPDELEDQQKKYPKTKKLVQKVLSVRPGVTGLWQVSGRSDVNFDKRIGIDAKYVDAMSLWGDIKIILRTPWAMISGKGAI